jgi:hypothetical protein
LNGLLQRAGDPDGADIASRSSVEEIGVGAGTVDWVAPTVQSWKPSLHRCNA